MQANHTLTRSTPTPEQKAFIEDRLYEYNRDQTGQDDGELLGFFIRDGDGEDAEIIGGVTGWTWARACYVEQLWVHPEWRGQGYGGTLLRAAEEAAQARGCEVLMLDTHSFQAPEFYLKNGYEQVWQMEDFPPGHRLCYFVKRLPARPS